MNYRVLKTLPTSEELRQELPLPKELQEQVAQDRKEIKAILRGEDPRLLMIIGPCSAWPQEAVLTYADRLAALQQELQDQLKLVMRVYIQKPRTKKGWTGPANQPNLFAPPNIEEGMFTCRNMMLQILAKGVAIADEALFPQNAPGFLELLSWIAIGARSTENQGHRIFASSVDLPVGLKNPTHGDLEIGVNSVIAAQTGHVTSLGNQEIETFGNSYAHFLLRGGDQTTNYDNDSLRKTQQLLKKASLKNRAVLIDVSHDNCLVDGKKDYQRQPQLIFDILENVAPYPELRQLVKGFMVESFLKSGTQKSLLEGRDQLPPNTKLDREGLSITDPCLGWEETEKLLHSLSSFMANNII